MEIQHLYQVPVQWSQRVYIYLFIYTSSEASREKNYIRIQII